MTSEGQVVLPSQFGRYTLIERLAVGGMAEVFRAKIVSSHGFEKIIVIKRILPHLAADTTFVTMFIDEAKVMAQLTHPKIVQVLDFGEVAGQFFIALEFIDGIDGLGLLRTAAKKGIRVPIPLVVFLATEVLDALDYAHAALNMEGQPMHLVHRDVSPSNIFIARHGDVKLGDFGIARADARDSKTQAGTLKGKYGYMSPEQVVGGALDSRSDVFAVGIVLAEALMGRRLFTARNDLDVLLMVRDARLDRLNRYGHDLPPEVGRIVRKALGRDVDARYQTAAELRNDLSDYLYSQKIRVGPADLRSFMTDLLDSSPEALARVLGQGRRLSEPHTAAGAPTPTSARAVAGGGATVEMALQEVARQRDSAPTPALVARAGVRGMKSPSRRQAPTETGPGDGDAGDGDAVGGDGMGRDALGRDALGRDALGGDALGRDTLGGDALGRDALGDARAAVSVGSLGPASVSPSPVDSSLAEALAAAELAVVDLDQWGSSDQQSSARRTGWTPVSPSAARPMGAPGSRGAGHPGSQFTTARTDVGRFVSAAPARPPDSAGDLAVISAMRVFADVTVAGETGLLRFDRDNEIKEVFLANGSPESVNSNAPEERFGAYLVARGVLRAAELEMALGMLPHFSGKLGDTLVGLGLMRPLDVFRQLSQQVRDRIIDLFRWSRGTFAFYRGVKNEHDSFPLGLDGFEILGAGVLTVPKEDLEDRFSALLDGHPRRSERRQIDPDAFHLGPTPREVLALLDGTRTLRSWTAQFSAPDELTTFLRSLHLLIETDLAELD